MKYIEPHGHMVSRTTDDYEKLALSGCEAICEPAFWAGFDRGSAVTVLRGGRAVVSKRVGTVTLNFADGQERAQARAQGGAYIDRAEATLPQDIREQITRERKAGDEDAAVDPLSDPAVKAAVARATFELLVGFQLTEQQLAYNATR